MRVCLFVLYVTLTAAGCAGVRPASPAPVYELSESDRAEIARVDHDLAAHGQVPQLAVDRPAVVSHFLRRTCHPGSDAASANRYRFHMSRLLNRMFWAKQMDWTDPHLDWDVWNAYLQLERTPETDWPEWSAWQLVLRHLWKNAAAIHADPTRAHWWLSEILDGSRSPRRATLVCFLVSCLDQRSIRYTLAIRKYVWPWMRAHSGWPIYWMASSPSRPLVQLSGGLPVPLQTFEGALDALARSIGYDWEAWGFEAGQLPAPRAPRRPREPRFSNGNPGPVLDHNWWSVGRDVLTQLGAFDYYGETEGWQPLFRVEPPSTGKLVLFSNEGTLLCWPRMATPDAALKLAVRAGLLAESELPAFYGRGYRSLDMTLSSSR